MNDQPDGFAEPENSDSRLQEVKDAKLTEILEAHKRWLESNGNEGEVANLARMNLEAAHLVGAKLKGANLRKACLRQADLSDADLRGAELYKADLRGARLFHARLRQASLVRAVFGGSGPGLKGANLTGADLRNSSLDDAELIDVVGLQADKLAGANLSNAKLPPDIARFEALEHVAEISRHARNIFLAVVGACVYSWLTVATTTDLALITGSAATPLPIIQTPVSIAGFYLAAPTILLVLYLYLHLYLQRMWEGMAELPAVFPDGRTLDRRVYPWLLSGLVSAHVPRLKDRRPPLSWLQVLLSVTAAWGLVPFTLFLFWGRYLVRHDWPWTIWHVVLLVSAAGFGFASYRLAVSTLCGKGQADQGLAGSDGRPSASRMLQALKSFEHRWVSVPAALAVILSLGAIEGSPAKSFGSPDYRDWRSWVPSPNSLVGLRTSADLRGAEISTKPPNWTGVAERPRAELEEKPGLMEKAKGELFQVTGAELPGVNLRNADAIGAFLAKANLEGAGLQEANLLGANLQEANLSGANLQGAELWRANLQGADLRNADLQRAYLADSELQGAKLQVASLQEVNLGDANLQGANLAGAYLHEAKLGEVDLKGANLGGAYLLEAYLRRADLREANLAGARLQEAYLGRADLREANLAEARLQEAYLGGTDLQEANLARANLFAVIFIGADLEGADLSRAKRLTVVSRHSSRGLTQAQLKSACGDPATKLPPGYKLEPCPGKANE